MLYAMKSLHLLLQRFYIVGKDKKCQHWQVLKIDRSEPSELNMLEDPVIYTQLECNKLMKRVDEGNKSTGGLTKVTKAYGIVGVFVSSSTLILKKTVFVL